MARRLLELAAAGAGVSGELTFGVSRRRKPAYRVSLPDEGSREAMLLEFGHTGRETSLRLNRANLENECCAAAFLRGAEPLGRTASWRRALRPAHGFQTTGTAFRWRRWTSANTKWLCR